MVPVSNACIKACVSSVSVMFDFININVYNEKCKPVKIPNFRDKVAGAQRWRVNTC